MVFLFWIMKKVFPKCYEILEHWENKIIKPIKIRSIEIISGSSLSAIFIVCLKLIRLATSLTILYFFVVYSFSNLPWTHGLNIKPVFSSTLVAVMISVAAYSLFKAFASFFLLMDKKTTEWRGTIIKSIKVKNLEILSDSRIIESIKLLIKVARFFLIILTAYFYITILFSLFEFTRTGHPNYSVILLTPLGKLYFRLSIISQVFLQ